MRIKRYVAPLFVPGIMEKELIGCVGVLGPLYALVLERCERQGLYQWSCSEQ
jgi:hypothetical protein